MQRRAKLFLQVPWWMSLWHEKSPMKKLFRDLASFSFRLGTQCGAFGSSSKVRSTHRNRVTQTKGSEEIIEGAQTVDMQAQDLSATNPVCFVLVELVDQMTVF